MHAGFVGPGMLDAACCGEVSVRTNWVLHTAGVTAPKLLLDVRPTAATICRRDVFTASPHQTFLSVYRMMMDHNFRSIPIVTNAASPSADRRRRKWSASTRAASRW